MEGDIRRWRREDAEFNKEVTNILENSETSMVPGPGRQRKDGGDLSWQDDFCIELIRENGNRKKASEVTPYSFGQILDFLNPETVSYDREFALKVETTEAEIAAEIEGMLLELRKPEAFGTFEAAKITQTKAWYALKVLEKLDRRRYGRYVDMNVKGSITHSHAVIQVPPEQQLFNLYEQQRQFLETKRLALIEGRNPDQKLDAPAEPVLEGEVIE